jgi:hypothetical protein
MTTYCAVEQQGLGSIRWTFHSSEPPPPLSVLYFPDTDEYVEVLFPVYRNVGETSHPCIPQLVVRLLSAEEKQAVKDVLARHVEP